MKTFTEWRLYFNRDARPVGPNSYPTFKLAERQAIDLNNSDHGLPWYCQIIKVTVQYNKPSEPGNLTLEECVNTGQHMKECNQDGYCEFCGDNTTWSEIKANPFD